MNIGEKIKYLRRQHGITQQELSKAAGIPLVTLQQYERGVRKQPRFEQIEKISAAFGISADKLLDLSELLNEDQMNHLRKRLKEEIEAADPQDVLECFGTRTPFENILNGNAVITQREAADIADSFGLSRRELIGETLGSSLDLNRIVERAEELRTENEKYNARKRAWSKGRKSELIDKIDTALSEHIDAVLEVCAGDDVVPDSIPSRISAATKIIKNTKELIDGLGGGNID